MAAKVKPGRELDELVAKVIGQKGRVALPYSTEIWAAWNAWEWLEEKHPWDDGGKFLLLGRYDSPSVIILEDTDFSIPTYEDWKDREPSPPFQKTPNFYIPGETYPHAIALAVVEAGKWLQK